MNSNYGNGDIGSSSTGSKSESKNASASSGSSSGSASVTAGSASKTSKETASSTEHGVDIKKYLDDAKSMGKNLESQMSTRPYVVLGAVAGVSFVAGSLLGSRIGQLAVAIGIGYAATHFLQDTDVKSLARKATQNL